MTFYSICLYFIYFTLVYAEIILKKLYLNQTFKMKNEISKLNEFN